MSKMYETKRLYLKKLDKEYGKMVLDYYIRNQEFLDKWESKKPKHFYFLKYQEEQLEKNLEDIKKGNLLKLWLFEKEKQNKIIGCISFNNIIRGPFLSCFLSYKLDKDKTNQGYMTEAVKKAIEIAFCHLKLHRIEANIMPKNKSSIRVVSKCGFNYEGISEKYLKINGKWEDHIHMVLLNPNL